MPVEKIEQRHSIRVGIGEDLGVQKPFVGLEQENLVVFGKKGSEYNAIKNEGTGEEGDEGFLLAGFVEFE
jgi:hypothetical protein